MSLQLLFEAGLSSFTGRRGNILNAFIHVVPFIEYPEIIPEPFNYPCVSIVLLKK